MKTSIFTATRTLFPLGDIVITTNAMATLSYLEYTPALARHAKGDWGDLPQEDLLCNEHAFEYGGRLFSAYGKDKRRFWIITETDRSVTTILLPSDY
jgi:hypothetical protein